MLAHEISVDPHRKAIIVFRAVTEIEVDAPAAVTHFTIGECVLFETQVGIGNVRTNVAVIIKQLPAHDEINAFSFPSLAQVEPE